MKRHVSRWLILAVMLAVIASGSAAQKEERYRELPNFFQVNERLYRGGQPQRGGLKKLSELGIKTVVNLRGEGDGVNEEGAEAEALGLRYFNIPMSALGRPTDEQVERVMTLIDDRGNWPVFVHCQRGSDRTGTIIAVYRILCEQWTEEQAIAEAKRFGLARIQFRKKDYISDFYERLRGDGQ
jgi:protein tyrosine/serine phosphatase